eukprot:1834687-Pleurochrysis_carterae.AAC.1
MNCFCAYLAWPLYDTCLSLRRVHASLAARTYQRALGGAAGGRRDQAQEQPALRAEHGAVLAAPTDDVCEGQ